MRLRFLAISSLLITSLFMASLAGAADERKLPAAATVELDWKTLNRVPVYHGGRIMPWQTLARTVSEQVTGRETPRVLLESELLHKEYDSAEMAPARALIYGGERKMNASELLLSWLLEPQVWEDIPFILCEHDELRDLLQLPHDDPDEKTKLRYVSPAQMAEQLQPDTEFFKLLGAIERKQREARQNQGSANLTRFEERAEKLWRRYALYRKLTSTPGAGTMNQGRFLSAAQESMSAWVALDKEIRQMGEIGAAFKNADMRISLPVLQGEADPKEFEKQILAFKQSAQQVAKDYAQLKRRFLDEPPPFGNVSEAEAQKRLDTFRGLITRMTSLAETMAIQANEMHISMYDDGDLIRVAPALNAAALDADRDTTMNALPWVSLHMILEGSPEVLQEYPSDEIEKVRSSFEAMARAYLDRESSQRAATFSDASRLFAASLRQLGESLNAAREELDIRNRDKDLLAYTAYPSTGEMENEVRYNELDPFKWTWVIALLSLFCFALCFGAARRPMYFMGLAAMAGCILWAIYGFSLRVSVTNWAPVTNMYETVVYVPLFVLVLGLWFLTTPLTWEGLKAAWRLSAIPGSWEATPLNERQTRLLSRPNWDVFGFVLITPRVAMMGGLFWLIGFAPIYDGGEVIMHFLPQSSTSWYVTDLNHLIVHLVKLACGLGTIWFGPRVAIATVGMIPFLPMTLRDGKLSQAVEEMIGRKWFALAATGVATFLFLLAWYSTSMVKVDGISENFQPLMPVLRSNFWLTIHVLTIVSSYGAGLLAWGLGVISMAYFLFGRYTTPTASNLPPQHAPARGSEEPILVSPRPPAITATLAGYCYKTMQVAVLLLAAGTILGGLWADVSWGRFWGWDPKEVFALVSLLIYLVILHGRFAGWTGNFGTALGTNLGAWAIIFSWYGVNFVLGVGLHAYGFGTGGQWQVGMFVLGNALFSAAAMARYLYETNRKVEIMPGTKNQPDAVTAQLV